MISAESVRQGSNYIRICWAPLIWGGSDSFADTLVSYPPSCALDNMERKVLSTSKYCHYWGIQGNVFVLTFDWKNAQREVGHENTSLKLSSMNKCRWTEIHNSKTQRSQCLSWNGFKEESCFFLSFCPYANRACPDVINWSISANNTAQTHHYRRKVFPFYFFLLSHLKTMATFLLQVLVSEWEWNLSFAKKNAIASESKQPVRGWVRFLVLWWTEEKLWSITQVASSLI